MLENTPEMSKAAEIILNYRRLLYTKRCSNFPTLHTEDVAEHSYYVSMFAVLIARECNSSCEDDYSSIFEDKRQKFDLGKVAIKGLFHDFEEAFVSDIPRNIKHSTPHTNEVINNAVDSLLDSIYEGSGATGSFALKYNRHAKDDYDGKLIDIVDMLELAIYCSEEYCSGNNLMKSLLDKAVRLLEMNEMYDYLYANSDIFSSLMFMLKSDKEKMSEIYYNSLNID